MQRGFARCLVFLCGALALGSGGCAFGPRQLARTHGPYADAVQRVYEEQLIRNVVRVRYNEPTSAVDVAAITAQFELSAQTEARPFFSTEATTSNFFRSFSAVLPDVLVHKTDRPTFTMNPIDQGDAVRGFLTPIPADTLVFLSGTGWPVSVIARLWVDRLNGVPNGPDAAGPRRGPARDFARFRRAAELLQAAHDRELAFVRARERLTEASGPLPADRVTAAALVEAAAKGMEYRPDPGGKTWTLVRKERRLVLEVTPGAGESPELAELASLLNLVPGLSSYDLVTFSGGVPDPLLHPGPPSRELRVASRNTSQVFFFLSNGVEVPAEHAECGLVQPMVDGAGKAVEVREVTDGLFEVRACKGGHKPPADAYVAVKYRGYWFYVDDRDAASKATMALMLQLSRLDFARQQQGAPVLTLPVGR